MESNKKNWALFIQIYVVLFNPLQVAKKKYLLCFLDDFSRKASSYFLVEKITNILSFQMFQNNGGKGNCNAL